MINIRVLSTSGGRRDIVLRAETCLVTIQDEFGVENPEFFLRGRQLNKFVSLSFQNVNDGDVVVVMEKVVRRRKARRQAKFSDMGLFTIANWSNTKRHESARINDMIWDGWELSRQHNRMMSFMWQKTKDKESETESQNNGKTVITEQAKEIQSSPLPVWFPDDGDGTGRIGFN